MLKNMKKSTKSNCITLGIVIGFFVLIQILSAAGLLTNSFSGQLVPICAYVILAKKTKQKGPSNDSPFLILIKIIQLQSHR